MTYRQRFVSKFKALTVHIEDGSVKIRSRNQWPRQVCILAVLSCLCTWGPGAEETLDHQAHLLSPFNVLGPTSFHLDANTQNAQAITPETPITDAQSYWQAMQLLCTTANNLSVMPAGIRLSAEGPTDIVESDKRWFAPVVISNEPSALTNAGPLALQATDLHYFKGLNENSSGMLAFNLYGRFAPVLITPSRPQAVVLSNLEWQADVGGTQAAGGNTTLARDLGMLPPDIGFAVDGIDPKASNLSLSGNLKYTHIRMHSFQITYGKEPLINLPDNSGWTVKMTYSNDLADKRQYLLFTPLSSGEMPWKMSPDRDLQIYSRHGELIRFTDQTSIGSNSIRLRLNISIKEGATISGKVRSRPVDAEFPFRLTIELPQS